jgi:hypothetical protein
MENKTNLNIVQKVEDFISINNINLNMMLFIELANQKNNIRILDNNKLNSEFIKMYQLPIPIDTNEFLPYYLNLYNTNFNTINNYKLYIDDLNLLARNIQKEENINFEQKYFQEKNELIEIIKDTYLNSFLLKDFLENKEEYQKKYNITNSKYKLSNREIYKEQNIGKTFISIDLKEANFNCLKLVLLEKMERENIQEEKLDLNSLFIFKSNSFSELVSNFKDLHIFKNSKKMRSYIYGNINPKQQQKIQNYLINYIAEELFFYFENKLNISKDDLVSKYFIQTGSDELLIDLSFDDNLESNKVNHFHNILNYIQKNTNLKELFFYKTLNYLNIEMFELGVVEKLKHNNLFKEFDKNMYVKRKKMELNNLAIKELLPLVKNDDETFSVYAFSKLANKSTLKTVPNTFYPLAYNLENNDTYSIIDTVFKHPQEQVLSLMILEEK